MAIPRNLANLANQLDTSGNPPKVQVGDSSVVVTDTGSNGTIAFTTDNGERMRVTSSGQFLYNTTSSASNIYFDASNITPPVQIVTNSQNAYSGMSIINYSAGAYGGTLNIGCSQSDTKGTNALTTNTGPVGNINFMGNDGTNFRTCAIIRGQIDGTSGSGDMPGRLVFATTADGATSATERMRIINSGYLKVSNDGTYPDGSTAANHYFNSNSTSESCVFIRSDSASISGMSVLFIRGNRNTTDNTFRLIAANNGNDTGVFNVRDSGNCVNTNNSYGSTSDVKLKQDIVDASSQWDDIKNIRIRKYRFKNNPTAPLSIGVIAQELETISPGLVESEDDYEEIKVPVLDKEGNPVLNEDGTPAFETKRNPLGTSTKSVKYSVLYMKAVKALQEAQLRIETLEAQNAAFEARLAALEAK